MELGSRQPGKFLDESVKNRKHVLVEPNERQMIKIEESTRTELISPTARPENPPSE
jgi:hypothetical protein